MYQFSADQKRQFLQALDKQLERLCALCHQPDVTTLSSLIETLDADTTSLVQEKFDLLLAHLNEQPKTALRLATYIFNLIAQYKQVSCLTDFGITDDEALWTQLVRPLSQRLLPKLQQSASLYDLFDSVFCSPKTKHWLLKLSKDSMVDLVDTLLLTNQQNSAASLSLLSSSNDTATRQGNNTKLTQPQNALKHSIYQSILILSYRLSGIGLHKELIRTYPDALKYHSAFIAQNVEVTRFLSFVMPQSSILADSSLKPNTQSGHASDSKHVQVLLAQCQTIVDKIRKHIYKTGLSISLTNKLTQIENIVKRLDLLVQICEPTTKNHAAAVRNQATALTELFYVLYASTEHRGSLRHVLDENTYLMSKKIVDNASKKGGDYISTDREGYAKMFKKAALGGVLIGIMAIIKISSANLSLAPFGVAFINSMIYGLGFVLIHLIHGTVATKQPAMTAAAIAATVQNSAGKKGFKLGGLAQLIVDIMRTQFIAIVGNIMLAMPVALFISFAWLQVVGSPLVSEYKAGKLLAELSPFTSLALFHAAIAGVYLFLSGIISGYYDNQAVYHKLSARIAQHPTLARFISSAQRQRLGNFVEAHLGAIMGNFLFGVMLGSTATLGYIFGLPIDIRHIAFASANLVYGMAHVDALDITLTLLLVSALGVVLIGIINLMVSFSLALILALKAKKVRFTLWGELFRLVAVHFITHPRDFFIPRKKPIDYAGLDKDGHVITERSKPRQTD